MVNGKRYIGQKKFDSSSRWKSYLGSGYYLMKAVKRYGKENFIRNIVDIAYSLEELNAKEIEWITNYNAVESEAYYNIIEGGNQGNHLKNINSIPVICINTMMIFDSINDASLWSGHTSVTIKNTYKLNFKKNKDEKLIFRPLTKKCIDCDKLFYSHVKKEKICARCRGCVHCVDCGEEFKKASSRQKKCKDCQGKKKVIKTADNKELSKFKKLFSKGIVSKLERKIPVSIKIYNKKNKDITIHQVKTIKKIQKIIGSEYSCLKLNEFEDWDNTYKVF